VINRFEKDRLTNMSEYEKKVAELSTKGIDEYTPDDIVFMVDGIIGECKDDIFLSNARNTMIQLLEIQLLNRPPKVEQEVVTEISEDKNILIEQIESILFNPDEQEYLFEEFKQPIDYNERVHSIGMAVLNEGIQNMSTEDYEYLYNAVDKKKAYEYHELDIKDLRVMDVSLEYLKNIEIARTK
jgi:hypothetical protein